MHGNAFTSQYGDTPNHMWTRVIEGLTDDECRDGLTRLAKQGGEFPPSLPQFAEACRPRVPGPRFLGANPTTPERLRLNGPMRPSPQRDDYVDKLKALFGPPIEEESSLEFKRYRGRNAVLSMGCTCKLVRNDAGWQDVDGSCPTCQAWSRLLNGVKVG